VESLLGKSTSTWHFKDQLFFFFQYCYFLLSSKSVILQIISTAQRQRKNLERSCDLFTGNLANDGFRLGRRIDFGMDLDLPSRNTKSGDALFTISNSAISSAWRHGPALGPSLHAICALCM